MRKTCLVQQPVTVPLYAADVMLSLNLNFDLPRVLPVQNGWLKIIKSLFLSRLCEILKGLYTSFMLATKISFLIQSMCEHQCVSLH